MEFSVELTTAMMEDNARLDDLAARGVTAVSAPIGYVESVSRERLRETAAAFKARGVKIDTAHPRYGSYNTADSLVNQYKAPRGLYVEQLKETLDRMSILGVRVAPLHTGGCCLIGAPQWAMDMCAETVNAVAGAASDAGITLALENTFFHVPSRWDGCGSHDAPAQSFGVEYDNVAKLCALIDSIGSPVVRACFDAGHAHYLGDLACDHAAMGGRIALYHVHDNYRANDSHLPPGYGTLDWEALGALIKGGGYASPVYIEAGPWMNCGYPLMVRQTRALLNGGRRGESRRCMTCGNLILTDEDGMFCAC